jgi:hypothetical protein
MTISERKEPEFSDSIFNWIVGFEPVTNIQGLEGINKWAE